MSTTALAGLIVQISDLPGNLLGQASGATITLERDAAGWGWYVDPTPRDDSEFLTTTLARRASEGPADRMDLLTAVMHEMGHALGLDHDGESSDVMYESLAAGTRRTPDGENALEAALAYSFYEYGKQRKV